MSAFDDWFARGRTHLTEGRPVDAMWCFRRAVRLDPAQRRRAISPRRGAVAPARGADEARAAWQRGASTSTPRHAPAHHALCRSLPRAGDAAAARARGRRWAALALFPDNARLRGGGDRVAHACRGRATDRAPRRRSPRVDAGPAACWPCPRWAARSRARSIARHASAARSALLAQLAGLPRMAARGAAAAAGAGARGCRARASTVRAPATARGSRVDATTRPPTTMRCVAWRAAAWRLDAATGGARSPQRYAALCAAVFAAAVRRYSGRAAPRARACVCSCCGGPQAGRRGRRCRGGLAQLPDTGFDVTRIDLDAQLDPEGGESEADRGIAGANAFAAGRSRCARRSRRASAAATGPLLAQRPARAIWTTAALPWHHVAPLVDACLPDAASLAAALDDDARRPGARAAVRTRRGHADRAAGPTRCVPIRRGDAADARSPLRGAAGSPAGTRAGALPARRREERARRRCGGARADFAAAIATRPDTSMRGWRRRATRRPPATPARPSGCAEDGARARSRATPGCGALLGLAQLARRDGAAAVAAFERALADRSHGRRDALQPRRRAADAGPAAGRGPRVPARAGVQSAVFPTAEFNLGILLAADGPAGRRDQRLRERAEGGAAATPPPTRISPRCSTPPGRIDAWLALFRRFEANCPDALSLAVRGARRPTSCTGDFAALERVLDRLRKRGIPAAGRERSRRVPGGAALPVALLRRRARDDRQVRADVRPRRAARLRRADAAPGDAQAGTPARGLPVRRPAQPRDGQDGVARALAPRQVALRIVLLFAVRREDDWTARFRELADHYEVLAAMYRRRRRGSASRRTTSTCWSISTRTRKARGRASSRASRRAC